MPSSRNKKAYLQIDGKPVNSDQFLKKTKDRINDRIVKRTELAAVEMVDVINDIIHQLTYKHPDPRYSVWRKYHAMRTRVYTRRGKDGLLTAKANVYVISGWPKFNLWEVYDRGGYITFRENARWPILTNNMVPRDPPDQPFRVLSASYTYNYKGYIRYKQRGKTIKAGRGKKSILLQTPVTDYYHPRYMYRRAAAYVAAKRLGYSSRKVENGVVRYSSRTSAVEFRLILKPTEGI